MSSLVTKEIVISAQTVNGTAVVTSDAFNFMYEDAFSYFFKVSGTAPKVTLTYEISDSDIADKNDICTNYDSKSEWLQPSTGGVIATDVTASKCDGVSFAVSKWQRFKVTGAATNGSDTVVTLCILKQSK